MSTFTPDTTDATARRHEAPVVVRTGETKHAFKTTELIAYVVTVLGVLIAAAVVDDENGAGFGAERAWLYITALTIGYLLSRGLAKAGSYAKDDNDSRR